MTRPEPATTAEAFTDLRRALLVAFTPTIRMAYRLCDSLDRLLRSHR